MASVESIELKVPQGSTTDKSNFVEKKSSFGFGPKRASSDIIFHAAVIRKEIEDNIKNQKLHGDQKTDTTDDKKDKDKDELRNAYKTDFHKIPLNSLEKTLISNFETGLTTAQSQEKIEEYGYNELKPIQKIPTWIKFLKKIFGGFFNILLWVGSVLCFFAYILDEKKDQVNLSLGFVLAFVVSATGTFSYFQESKSEAIMEEFKNFLPQTVLVKRDSNETRVDAKYLVPGDIIRVNLGDKLPADVRFLTCNSIQVDNSTLTGESEPQERSTKCTHENPMESKNLAFFGTMIIQGNGTAIVIKTGDNTLMGRIARLADETETVDTPIAKEIKHFVFVVSCVAIFLGVSFFIIGISINPEFMRNILFMIGIIVANVPEGLLATVTVSLALTAQRMAIKNVLVKNLEAVETLGSTTVICSDKTGTLTRNEMTIAHISYSQKIFEVNTLNPVDGEFNSKDKEFNSLLSVISLCNTADFSTMQEEETEKVEEVQTSCWDRLFSGEKEKTLKSSKSSLGEYSTLQGNASEKAMVKFSNPNLKDRFNDKIEKMPIQNFRDENEFLWGIPFNSSNKWALSVHCDHSTDCKQKTAYLKGAPEKILSYCEKIGIDGENQLMTPEHSQTIMDNIYKLASMGQRVIGCAMLPLDSEQFPNDFVFNGETDDTINLPFKVNNPEGKGFTFIGLIAMIDPPRPGVPLAVRKCQSAGIRVIMVTGDMNITAKAIAEQVGIIKKGNYTRDEVAKMKNIPINEVDPKDVNAVVIHGQDLQRELENRDENGVIRYWNDILQHEDVVFARTNPQQKLLIVESCQLRDGVVAVTGDGVNDSPALKKADIGIAMGIVGTDVAKDAADMILLDDNFASIVNGVEEGRIIFDNLKKSIAYTLSSNIPEISPFLAFIAFGIPLPLTTVLILCIDLGTDLVPAISFAREMKEADIMERPPRNAKTDRLVTGNLICFSYLNVGMAQAAAGFFTYFSVLNDFGFYPSMLIGLDRYSQWGREDLYCYANDYPTCHFETKTDLGDLIFFRDSYMQAEALVYAQAAFLVSIVVVQWADLLICKTRNLTIFNHGMENRFMNFGLFFETALVCILCYTPGVNTIFGI